MRDCRDWDPVGGGFEHDCTGSQIGEDDHTKVGPPEPVTTDVQRENRDLHRPRLVGAAIGRTHRFAPTPKHCLKVYSWDSRSQSM